MVGNDFVAVPRPRPPVIRPKLVLAPATPVAPTTLPVASEPAATPQVVSRHPELGLKLDSLGRPWKLILDTMHRFSLAAFALLFLAVGTAGIQVAGNYWQHRVLAASPAADSQPTPVKTIAGLNLTVSGDQLAAKLQAITNQSARLVVGDQTVAVPPETIQSWLNITASRDKSESYIRIKRDAMAQSLLDLANQFVKAPVDQVTVSHDGASRVIVAGQNGTKLTNPNDLKAQAAALAKRVMNAQGLHFSTSLENQTFAALTPAAYDKMIEVNVDTKQMYLYEKGQVTSTYAVSAGAAETPTPIGKFQIWSKLAKQTMTGYNPNGTKYIQPNVPWISYFDHSGDAIHGNYWRPASVFGSTNTSHGCVSLPVDLAKVVYDWAPIGTTVITHH